MLVALFSNGAVSRLAWVPVGLAVGLGCSVEDRSGDRTAFTAKDLTARFGPRGFAVAHANEDWSVDFETEAIRCGAARWRVGVGDQWIAEGPRRMTTLRTLPSGTFEEWVESGVDGVEQGFTLARDPCGAVRGELVIEVAVAGLVPSLWRQSVELRDHTGHLRARYAGLTVQDADGRPLQARVAVSDASLVELHVRTDGARWPVVVDPVVTTAPVEVLAPDGQDLDYFGMWIAMDGGTALIGAPGTEVAGALIQGVTYVYVRNGGSWSLESELTAPDGGELDSFGIAVALDGDTALVGANLAPPGGAAYVFVRDGGTWSLQAKLAPYDGVMGDEFGYAVALSGDTALVGAYAKAQARGAAYVFSRSGTTWTQDAKLSASDALNGDTFGTAVALSGSTALIGAPTKTVGANSYQGAAYVFERSGSSWSQQQKLVAADGAMDDLFGWSVALGNGIAILGAPGKSIGSNTEQGAAYVFAQQGTWAEQARITASNGGRGHSFGRAVAVSGAAALVGATDGDSTSFSGGAYLYVQGDGWTEEAHWTPSEVAWGDAFGNTVALADGVAFVGAPRKDVAGNTYQGAAYVTEVTGLLGDSCGTSSECATPYVCGAGYCSTPCHVCPGRDLASCTPLTDTACDDGNACTQVDTCQGGVCIGTNPVVCTASDQCHDVGTCDPATGTCSDPARPDNDPCNDGDACTQTDTCQAGVCIGTSPVVCTASDQCHEGVCDPATGACSYSAKPDNEPCNDGDACTQTDTCQAGVCIGTSPVVCTASDQCHDVGTCDAATGICSDPAKPDNDPCSDGDTCTRTDTCQAGVCIGRNPVVCTASDQCHDVGTCDPATGICSDPAKPDGAECAGGVCAEGECVPDSAAGAAGAAGSRGAEGTAGDAGSEAVGGGTPGGAPSLGGAAGLLTSGAAGAGAGGGTQGAGGGPSGAAGTQGFSGRSASPTVSGDEGGCGCRAADSAAGTGARGWLAVLLTILLFRSRSPGGTWVCRCGSLPRTPSRRLKAVLFSSNSWGIVRE